MQKMTNMLLVDLFVLSTFTS